ncbi:Transposase [Cordylochernes scorpioides]|uniref:Transposase n=1 Tax=Cordylochernes scorpioides TaxID=51811 RepID=A0ABY6K9L9_9ARAC|nr:Transposase [Cordylochernes scorpioides]
MEDASIGEQEKLLRLPNYLARQPLELFRKLRMADRSYFQVRQILLDLYPESSEASFAKYFAMKLTGQANLETYYREKTAMGLQLGLPQEVILETLTEGLPFNDQRLVRVVPPENLGEWFRLVQRIHGPSHTPTPRCMECTSSAVQLQVLRREALAQRMPTSTSPDDPRKSADGANSPKTTSPDSTTTKSSQGHPSRAALSRLRTISRRLVANGLHSCRPLRRLPLTPPNRRQRLEWCRARSTWMTEWHRVVFSDESRFCLSSDSRRVRVWRRRGERSNPAAIGTMTAQRYVDDVLRPVTLPYFQGVPNALYQQDNARPHTARISQQALQDVQMLPWQPYSPDLSPIEHVWDIIGRRLHALPQPRSEDELWQMVEREWRAIPQDAIRTLIDSLPRRVAARIAVRGGPTCY